MERPSDVVRRFVERINADDFDGAAAMLGPGYVHHSGAGDLSLDEFRSGYGYYRAAFPDLRYDLDEVIDADGDRVVARWTMRGTMQGPFFGAQPEGKAFASGGLSLHRVVDGLIVEDWEFSDDTGMMASLGFRRVPPSG